MSKSRESKTQSDKQEQVQASEPLTTNARQVPLWANNQPLQMKSLRINQPGDPHERQADSIAQQVVHSPRTDLQRCSCGGGKSDEECPSCRAKRLQRSATNGTGGGTAPDSVHSTLNRPGRQMDTRTQSLMESRFGADFSDVRIHTDDQAAQSASDVRAKAYTVNNQIVFGSGQYAPETQQGKLLLAHELAHVLQQREGEVQLQRQPDDRVNDPNFLLCLVLCYLGIPPAIWRTAINMVLSAVSEEYKHRYGEVRGSREFEEWRVEFLGWSALNILKAVLTFAADGKIAIFSVMRSPAARRMQARLVAWMVARGATSAGIAVAAQAVRKVAIALEVIWVTGCAAYCAGVQIVNALSEFSQAALNAISTFSEIVSGIAGGVAEALIFRPLLTARATMDPNNWETSLHVYLIGQHLYPRLHTDNPDRFLVSIGRPMSEYDLPSGTLSLLASEMTRTVQQRSGFNIEFSADMLRNLTPLTFVQFLHDYDLLRFERPPEEIADEVLRGTPE